MKKSILDQFASDAINAPVAITGGCGGKKTKGHKSKGGSKSGSKGGSKGKSHGSKGGCGCKK